MADKRPDLAMAPFKAPPFIGSLVMPPLPQAQLTGSIYYQDIQGAGSVQTDRTLGTAPTATALDDAVTTFDLETSGQEKIHRKLIPEAKVNGLGGLAQAQLTASRISKRAVLAQMEAEVAAKILANASVTYTDILNDMLGQMAADVEVVADYAVGVGEGVTAFVTSTKVINLIKKYAEVTAVMVYTGVIPKDGKLVRNISLDILAEVLGVDKVLAGPLAQWYTASATYQQRGAIMVLPDADADPLEQVQYGRQATFPVNEQGPNELFLVETYHDDNLVSYVEQTRAWSKAVEFNVELVRGLKGFDAGNASSTTTTTTTTTGG